MAIMDWIFSGQVSHIASTFKMVSKLTKWAFGLDKRMARLERRTGKMEMAMIQKGFDIEPEEEETPLNYKGPEDFNP